MSYCLGDVGGTFTDLLLPDQADGEAPRGEMRAGRGDRLATFNLGPDIETLRADCVADTGLMPPRAPQWQQLAIAAE